MRPVDIIDKKRNNKALSKEEISRFFQEYLHGGVTDYQVAAFLMAICFNGMSNEEIFALTSEMIASGETIKFDDVEAFLIDKHSTGGVGDKTSIAIAPLIACLGMATAKLSGRGLGHTGGTIDKFEAIEGFQFAKNETDLNALINQTGIGIAGAAKNIVPLDKKLYALRDVTATVQSIPLIASSIMSKKLAIHADGIILDVKVGSGAFMKDTETAKELSKTMLQLAKDFERKMIVVLSNMDQPLGFSVGNSLELIEAIETLKGNGPKDFTELVIHLVATALFIKGDTNSIEEATDKVKALIGTEEPLEHLRKFIKESGGNEKLVDDYTLLPVAEKTIEVVSTVDGYVHKIVADQIGNAAMELGAGRKTKTDQVDHSVGIILHKKVGDKIEKGDGLATLYFNSDHQLEDVMDMVKDAYTILEEEISAPKVILETIIS
ncbi:thymidine phosphorylase [Sediminitomix flava]|uniref:thymidine phosphorylase n=1 Tax=Sediminitomix flava TaxID=379075 RepID=A0A315Z6G3_SEDFL|nr:thymidine phosphorylase [Sediminitomix flava]PWJ39963.1 pyrimidine-nucleoside phosphorylase [Sediminitomix flava]